MVLNEFYVMVVGDLVILMAFWSLVLTSSWVLTPPLLIIIRFKHHETSLLGCMTPTYTLGDWFHGVECVFGDGCWGFSHFYCILVVLTSSWVLTPPLLIIIPF